MFEIISSEVLQINSENQRILLPCSSCEVSFDVRFNNFLGGAGHFAVSHNSNEDILKRAVGNAVIIGNLTGLPIDHRPTKDRVALIEYLFETSNDVIKSTESEKQLENDKWYNVRIISSLENPNMWTISYEIRETRKFLGINFSAYHSSATYTRENKDAQATGLIYFAQVFQKGTDWSIDIKNVR